MKTTKKLFSVLSICLAVVATLLLFIVPFAQVNLADGSSIQGVAAEFAFGSVDGRATGKSSDILFCGILTLLTAIFAGLSFKFKGSRWATVGFSFVDAVYMLVIAFSHSNKFIDIQGFVAGNLINDNSTKYLNNAPLLISVALFLTFASSVTYLLIADKLAVIEEGSGKLTIPKKIVKFLKDYKSEFKKIVWPNFRTVMKNTLIVFLMCAAVGLFIWAIDFGLDALLKLIYK